MKLPLGLTGDVEMNNNKKMAPSVPISSEQCTLNGSEKGMWEKGRRWKIVSICCIQ